MFLRGKEDWKNMYKPVNPIRPREKDGIMGFGIKIFPNLDIGNNVFDPPLEANSYLNMLMVMPSIDNIIYDDETE